jgi:hypothetical protein
MSTRRPVPLLLLFLAACVAASLASFAAAQDITAVSAEVHQFNSPMILDLTLARFQNNGLMTMETKNYSCRGVTIDRLILSVAEKKGNRELRVSASLFNNSGKDKKATLRYDLMQAAAVTVGGTSKVLTVEQGAFATGYPITTLPLSIAPDEITKVNLRVTLTLVDY